MKELVVSLEHRFYKCGNSIYTKLAFEYGYWEDYLQEFDDVVIFARCKEIGKVDYSFKLVTGENVRFVKVPYYQGVGSFAKKLPSLLRAANSVSTNHERFLLRSGNVTNILWPFLIFKKKPYLREFPGNIKEGVKGYVGKKNVIVTVLALFLDRLAKLQAKYSAANSFVSAYCKTLYHDKKVKSFVFSSVSIDTIESKKQNYCPNRKLSLVSVGRLENEKGHLVLLEALKCLDMDVTLKLIGDGSRRGELEKFSQENNLDCTFFGAITDKQRLYDIVAGCDVFILPSITEGMPRALLEAMAIGMPCISTVAGGIPEVLSKDYLAEPGSSDSLKDIFEKLLSNDSFLMYEGDKNKQLVKDRYSKARMAEIKKQFWSCLP